MDSHSGSNLFTNLILTKVLTSFDQYRYTFFYILYPVGAGSEAIEIYQALPFAHTIHPGYYYFLVAMLCIYPPGNTLPYSQLSFRIPSCPG